MTNVVMGFVRVVLQVTVFIILTLIFSTSLTTFLGTSFPELGKNTEVLLNSASILIVSASELILVVIFDLVFKHFSRLQIQITMLNGASLHTVTNFNASKSEITPRAHNIITRVEFIPPGKGLETIYKTLLRFGFILSESTLLRFCVSPRSNIVCTSQNIDHDIILEVESAENGNLDRGVQFNCTEFLKNAINKDSKSPNRNKFKTITLILKLPSDAELNQSENTYNADLMTHLISSESWLFKMKHVTNQHEIEYNGEV